MFLAYIGPGPGLAIQAPLLVMVVALIAAVLSLLSFPFRYLRRRRLKRRPSLARQVVVVGLDGLEPTRVERLMAAGRLPHLEALAKEGGYQRLGTTCPPLSPVAWSSFSTGVNPGRHGIFGFVERDRDYRLRLTSASVRKVRARLGSLALPWHTEKPVFQRMSTSFWKILGDFGVLVHVLRVPITWPPEKFSGFLLSAMGAPDLLGTQGTYTLFSTKPKTLLHGNFQRLETHGEERRATIYGPEEETLPLSLLNSSLRVGRQTVPLILGEFTPWLRLPFGKAWGLARFLKLDDDSLYMTPIQVDPARPAVPLSWPPLFATTLSSLCGPFATCGLAEDTGAREDEVLTNATFLEHAYSIHEERERQFFHLLERTPEGCLIGVFDGPDRIAHMFSGDDQEDVLDTMVERMDALVGKIRAKSRSDSALFVLSDHGFKPLRMLVDVNAWLHQARFLTPSEGEVDWPLSRAAVYNLSGIRLNMQGRESQGIVSKSEAKTTASEIRSGLLALRHEDTPVFLDVFLAEDVYNGPYIERAPDLVLGFAPGFGIYKDASRGFVSQDVFHANTSAWSGDHCFHPDAIPGVLFSNRKLREGAHITDLSATVLDLHGIDAPLWMEGRSLLTRESGPADPQAAPPRTPSEA